MLYYIIKGHPFNDGNKRIGAFMFILFLSKNNMLYKSNENYLSITTINIRSITFNNLWKLTQIAIVSRWMEII